MDRGRRRWMLITAVAVMLAALFSYIATLDDADPDALPASAEQVRDGLP